VDTKLETELTKFVKLSALSAQKRQVDCACLRVLSSKDEHYSKTRII
jgi:hypothetical protein